MAEWVGANWQIIEAPDEVDAIGVTWGLGLLDEPVESTGVLGATAAALRRELERPVELGAGRVGVPEVRLDLSSDTTSLSLHGPRDVIAAAWRRLPELLSARLATEGVTAEHPGPDVWIPDITLRSGRNSMAVAWLGIAPGDVAARAAALAARLNPETGSVPAVFFTTVRDLAGAAFVIREALPVARSGSWGDGTAWPATGADAESDERNGNARFAEYASEALISCLVPRTSSGVAAGYLVRRQLEAALRATTGGEPGIRIELHGFGAALLLAVKTDPPVHDAARAAVVEDFARRLTIVPDTWMSVASSVVAPPWVTREARVRGQVDGAPVTAAEIHAALRCALRSLHFSSPSFPAEGKNVDTGIEPTPFELSYPLRTTLPAMKRMRRHHAIRANDPATIPGLPAVVVEVGAGAIAIGRRDANGSDATVYRFPVDTDRLLVVLEDRTGALTLVDDFGRFVRFHPALHRGGRGLRAEVVRRTQGVPWFSTTSDLTTQDIARVRRRSRNGAVARIGVPLVILGIASAAIYGPRLLASDDGLAFAATATLSTGVQMNVTALWPQSDAGADDVSVLVELCGPAGDVAAVDPAFVQMVDDDTNRPLAQVGDTSALSGVVPLDTQTLGADGCARGDLVFERDGAQDVSVVYGDPDGTVWTWGPDEIPAG
ncbi:hypothetical protein [Microbacterium indicum]|uniref:hypothetical protein n=1 Tax=Microbacterium indicum TaxID=358100 RepID=UPI000427BE78|nr:hypothetical protein [Microbacterium indicum]